MRFLPLLLVLSSLAIAQIFRCDFESGIPKDLIVRGATLTRDPSYVISGRSSLFCDTRQSNIRWNEFLHTAPSIRFSHGKKYLVTFNYRIIDPGKKARLYMLLRSRSGNKDLDLYGPFWTREPGGIGNVEKLFVVEKTNDYYLIIGVENQGAFVIDDLQIMEVGFKPKGWGQNISSFPNAFSQKRQFLDWLRQTQGIYQLMQDMAIIVLNEGAGKKAVDRKDEIVRDLKPDFIDWNPIGPLAKDYGIRTSGGALEYQELYPFEAKDIWDKRFNMFVGSGMAENLCGVIVQDETWGPGGYFMCHNGDNWHNYFIKRILEAADKYLSICQDNIFAAPFIKGETGFCPACQAKFRAYLKTRYSLSKLKEWGINNIDTFSIKRYINYMGNLGEYALQDPIIREYIKFQYISHAMRWAEVVEAVKRKGISEDRFIPVYGNQLGCEGFIPYALLLSQFNDVVQIEEVLGIRDHMPRLGYRYKIGAASGYFTRPVWIRGPVVDWHEEKLPALQVNFWAVHLAEGLASGGIRDISLGINASWTGNPKTLDYIDSPNLYAFFKNYASFVDKYRPLWQNRDSLAAVALVYPFSSAMWRSFPPLNLRDAHWHTLLKDTATLLEENHIPYDVLIFGHPELFDDTPLLSRLKRYKALILLDADCLSDSQIKALREFAASGGQLFKVGNLALYDENFNPRPSNPLADLDIKDFQKDQSKILMLLQDLSPIRMIASAKVTCNIWLDKNGGWLAIHLVNYDIDIPGDYARESGPMRLNLYLPRNFTFTDALFLTYQTEEKLDFERRANRLVISLPSIDTYGIVLLKNRNIYDKEEKSIQKRRSRDKKFVMEQGMQGFY